ncbi:MAG: PCMD domain-containing protein [Porphyromonas sp.]|nr:PCMD domain-containing protein [Porphyromonas sp.]
MNKDILTKLFRGSLTTFLLATLATSCYQHDPIRDKLNQRENNKATPKPTPSPEEKPGEDLPSQPETGTNTFLFDFESWRKLHQYEIPTAPQPFDPDFWTSGSNEGFKLIPGKQLPYPVSRLDNSIKGKGVRIQSRPGAVFLGMGSHLVAGSMYSGSVNTAQLVSKPLESNHFGRIFPFRPLSVRGYYRYIAGEKFIDGTPKGGGKELPGNMDKGVIAAVFYEVNSKEETLDGSNLYTSGKIVAIGKMELGNTDGWQHFNFALSPVSAEKYKEINLQLKKYKLALIFSSSYLGDLYQGAIGSTLDIDEIEIEVTDKNPK